MEQFCKGNIPARITQAGEIDLKSISERFESTSVGLRFTACPTGENGAV